MAVIGIDLDATLASDGEWEGCEIVRPPNTHAVEMLMRLHYEGHLICIWTTRPDYIVQNWLRKYNLSRYVHFINKSPYPTESGKASFDFYIGDDAVRWTGDNTAEILKLINNPDTKNPGIESFERETEFCSHNPRPYFQGVGRANVDRFEHAWKAVWAERESDKPIAFLTICSHAKPYSKSYIHMSIRKRLMEQRVLHLVDYIHISNAGIIPTDAEMQYPFNAYDWDGSYSTPEITAYHTAAIKRRFAYWLDNYGVNYAQRVVYLRGNGNTCGAVAEVLKDGRYDVKLIRANHEVPRQPLFPALPDPDDCLFDWSNLSLLKREVFIDV